MRVKLKSSFKIMGIFSLGILTALFLPAARPGMNPEESGVCLECHEDMTGSFPSELHSLSGVSDCTVCHGNPDRHLEEGGGTGNITAFNELQNSEEKSRQCLKCHSTTMTRFFSSPHGQSSLDCTECHSIHENREISLLAAQGVKVCSECHGDVAAEFQLNEHHRLVEGVMNCASCHDPHEPSLRQRLGGFRHESCFQCHPDKGGPFLFEHQASRIEGCGACHSAHGSPNRHMLNMQSISDLCFSCHTAAPSWHSRFTSGGTNCTVCHSTIHGSNLSRIFLK